MTKKIPLIGLTAKQYDAAAQIDPDAAIRYFIGPNESLTKTVKVACVLEGVTVREFVSRALMRRVADTQIREGERFITIGERLEIL